jgi:hypothetical protein
MFFRLPCLDYGTTYFMPTLAGLRPAECICSYLALSHRLELNCSKGIWVIRYLIKSSYILVTSISLPALLLSALP